MHKILEIGPGRGDFLFHLAEINPDAKVIGIELKPMRYFKLIDRMQKRGLTNIQLIQADARLAVEELFEKNSLDEIHINFPDPWPKRKHGKNRLITAEFVKNCSNLLKKDGVLNIVTDAEFYADEIRDKIFECTKKGTGTFFSEKRCLSPFPTLFAQKWMKEGRRIYPMRWVKR